MNDELFSFVNSFAKFSSKQGYCSSAKYTAVYSLQGGWKLIKILVANTLIMEWLHECHSDFWIVRSPGLYWFIHMAEQSHLILL